MANGNDGKMKPPATMVLTQGHGAGAGVHVQTKDCSWQNAVNMLINALVTVRRMEEAERKKVIVEATPGDVNKLVNQN